MKKDTKHIAVLGAGESGIGAAILAKKHGLNVLVSDNQQIRGSYKKELNQNSISHEELHHTEPTIMEADEIVKSPGIPDDIPLLKNAASNGIPVISEVEFASRYTNAVTIGITGSNGKTTTALLTHQILKNAGLNAGLAGNIGKSFARQVAEENNAYYVLEISSFQLDGAYAFKPDVAVLLNITPDHLNRYGGDFRKYTESKFRLIQNLSKNEYFIYCADDDIVQEGVEKRTIKAHTFPFSVENTGMETGGYLENEVLHFKTPADNFTIPVTETALHGKHNMYNILAAGLASKLMDVDNAKIRESLSVFEGVEHRLETVASVDGRVFINDSKATNIISVWYALESMSNPVVWIAGGQDKGNDYSIVRDLVKEKVTAIICIGTDNSKIREYFAEMKPVYETGAMKDAVHKAYKIANTGDTVLLSPACASFDLFDNYEDRGTQFKYYVKLLADEK